EEFVPSLVRSARMEQCQVPSAKRSAREKKPVGFPPRPAIPVGDRRPASGTEKVVQLRVLPRNDIGEWSDSLTLDSPQFRIQIEWDEVPRLGRGRSEVCDRC